MILYTNMSRSPRAEALRLLHSGAAITAPEMPSDVTPNSPEALAYIESYKEKHFVALSRAMDMLLAHALENRRPDDRNSQAFRGMPKNKWQGVADLWRADLEESLQAISSSDTYQTADAFALVTGRLNTERHISLDDKMMGGIGTGVVSSFTILRNIPLVLAAHQARDEAAAPEKVARHPRSLELVRRLAKLSIDQSLAAQTALTGASQPSRWADFDKVLLPPHFRVHRYADGRASLGYRDFDNLRVPAGYKPRDPFEPVTTPTLITEIPSDKNKIIGCPITLPMDTLPMDDDNRLRQLWDWGIDLVRANKLWSEPAPGSPA